MTRDNLTERVNVSLSEQQKAKAFRIAKKYSISESAVLRMLLEQAPDPQHDGSIITTAYEAQLAQA